jgi:hypothetical protein
LKQRRIVDVADLNRAAAGINPQVTGHADGAVCRLVNDRVEQRVAAATVLLHPRAIVTEGVERAIREVRPIPALRVRAVSGVKTGGVALRLHRLKTTKTPLDNFARRSARGLPVGDEKTNRLIQVILIVQHK